jgi:superkiller protein 3
MCQIGHLETRHKICEKAMKSVLILVLMCCLSAALLSGCQSVYVTSAKVYLQQNDFENAKKQLQEGLQINPKDAEAHYLLGKIYAQQDQYAEMLQEFDAALALNQKNKADIEKTKAKHFRDLFNEAVEKFNNKQPEEAIPLLKQAVLIAPEDREAWSLLSKSQIRLKQYVEGKTTLQKAISLDPQYTSLDDRVLLMEMQYNDGQQMEALNIAEEILGKDAANKDAIRVAAFSYNYLAMQEQDATKKAALQNKALDYYQKVLESQPDDADLVFNLGLLYEAMERYDEAIAQYERAFTLNPKDLEAVLHKAQIYLDRKNDNQKAIEGYQRALELDPDNAGIWNNLGVALIRAGEKTNDEALIKEGTTALKKAEELRGKQ